MAPAVRFIVGKAWAPSVWILLVAVSIAASSWSIHVARERARQQADLIDVQKAPASSRLALDPAKGQRT
jgi:hypothetical protein